MSSIKIVSGFRFQVSGFRFQVAGCRFQVAGFRFQVAGCRFQVSGLRTKDERSMVSFVFSLWSILFKLNHHRKYQYDEV